MPLETKIFFYFLIYFILFGLPLYGIYKLPTLIRSVRMKQLSKKYNLNYTKISELIKFELLPSGKGKRNWLSGEINKNKIEIFDYIDICRLFGGYKNVMNGFHTVFIKDGNEEDVEGFLDGFFRVRIGKIDKWLNDINNKKNNSKEFYNKE